MIKDINSKFFWVGALLLLAGCQSEDDEPAIIVDDDNWQAEVSFEGIQSKELKMAVLNTGPNAYSQKWEVGDKFKCVDDQQDENGYYTKHNTITFELKEIGGNFMKCDGAMKAPSESHYVFAYYPASNLLGKFNNSYSHDGICKINLPNVQNYVSAEAVESGAFPMFCLSQKTTFSFKNIEGIVCVKLKTQESDLVVKSITLKNSEKYLSGNTLVQWSSSEKLPSLIFDNKDYNYPNRQKYVKLNIAEGKKLTKGVAEPFHIVIPPNTYPAGTMSLVIETNKYNCTYIVPKEWVVARSSANTYTRNLVLSLGIAGVEGEDGDYAE